MEALGRFRGGFALAHGSVEAVWEKLSFHLGDFVLISHFPGRPTKRNQAG